MSAESDPEGQLVAAARGGDTDAFTELVRRHEGHVLAVCRRMLADPHEAEECAQEAFLKAWRNLPRFQERAAFSTWMHRIAVNEALQQIRRRRAPQLSLDDDALAEHQRLQTDHAAPQPTDLAEQREVASFLDERLRALPDLLRSAVVLRDVEGYSNDEVASLLELSLPAAKARIHRGRMILRAELEQWRKRDGDRR
ncbi:MAG: RNA polymerase sigma factor [Solirubrobacterales bacterium]